MLNSCHDGSPFPVAAHGSEIAADNQRADELGLVFDSDPRHDKAPLSAPINAAATVAVPQDPQDN